MNNIELIKKATALCEALREAVHSTILTERCNPESIKIASNNNDVLIVTLREARNMLFPEIPYQIRRILVYSNSERIIQASAILLDFDYEKLGYLIKESSNEEQLEYSETIGELLSALESEDDK